MASNPSFGIFCRTYFKDAERLRYLLLSIEKFCSGFDQIVVATPESSLDAIAPIVDMFKFAELRPCNTWSLDYVAQQITKLTSDRYIETDYVTHIDSDCIFSDHFTPADLFEDGRPVLYHAAYRYFYEHGYNVPWQSPTSTLLRGEVAHEFMRRFPLTYPRELYIDLQEYMEEKHGIPLDRIYEFFDGALLSEFNLLGAYSYGKGDKYHKHIDQLVEAPRQKEIVKQMCLYDARDDRGLTDDDRSTLTKFLGNWEADKIERTPAAAPVRAPTSYFKGLRDAIFGRRAKSKQPGQALDEMRAFAKAQPWDGGYADADPLVPLAWSSYSTNGFVSVYYATYLACIKPYVRHGFKVMEIGPGRGVWTRALIRAGAEKVYALDVHPRESNVIDDVLGADVHKLEYIVVSDFSGDGVPEDIDLFFSFGTFVHFSRHAQSAYIETLAKKMKKGAQGFIQFADVQVWNRVVTEDSFKIHRVIANKVDETNRQEVLDRLDASEVIASRETVDESIVDNEHIAPGRYFYVGTDWLAETLRSNGFRVVDTNVIETLRDPIIHFEKI